MKGLFSCHPLFFLPLLFLFAGGRPYECLLFLAAVAIHEAGHLFVARWCGCPIETMRLSPFGATLQLKDPYCPYKKEILIHLAGPTANLLAAGITLFFLRQQISREGLYFLFCNAFLLLFQLLPVKSLDGGRALTSALALWGTWEAAEQTVDAVGGVVLFLLAGAGIALFLKKKNPSLMATAFSMMLEGRKKRKRLRSDRSLYS